MVASLSTQCNYTFAMLDWALELHASIDVFFTQTDSGASKVALSLKEWSKMKQLCAFLEPHNQGTELIPRNQSISLVLVAPIYIWVFEMQPK